MQLQKGNLPDSNKTVWMVLDDDYLPIEPIQKYLRYLESLERSPNTIRGYAKNLKLYWEFLRDSHLDWREVKTEHLADFIHWLRNPDPRVISLQPVEALRTEKTINHALTTICGFYEFQEQVGATEGVNAYRYQVQPGRKYKSFLHHISKGKEVKTRLLKLKEPKSFPGCLTKEQVTTLVNACEHLRDKFLICLLYETGLRIGEALGLRHEDIVSEGKNEICVVQRFDNFNNVRAKSGERNVHVDMDLLRLYSDYLIEEYPEDIDSDYVFVSIWSHTSEKGLPMTYGNANGLFRRLSKKTGIEASAHLLRHTHATELIRAGWDAVRVQKRLGHADVQTTINSYVHLLDDDMREEYQKYLKHKEEANETESKFNEAIQPEIATATDAPNKP